VSVVVALAGCAVVTAAGWGVEMVGLPQPTHADRLVASAEGWLRDYPLAIVAFHATNAPVVDGICLRTSVGSFARSRLAVTGGPVFAVSTGHVRRVRGRRLPGFPALLASRIGCTATLLQPVLSAAVTRVHVEADQLMTIGVGEGAIVLNLPPYKGQRLVLYVLPESGRPILAAESLRGVRLTATLRLERPTPRLLVRLRPKLGLRR
jgi:hypothetical protein